MSHTELFEAVEKSDIEKVIVLVKDLDKNNLDQIVNSNGQNPLMVAVLRNNLALSTILLDAGFDPSQKDVTELPPFHCSSIERFR